MTSLANSAEAAASRHPLPPVSVTGASPGSEADFFSALSVCLGLSPNDAADLGPSKVFTGPAGLPCKVVWQASGTGSAARPEILLPLSADELMGPEVRQLLTVQGLMLSEYGWYLGVSGEGLLQLTPLAGLSQPADVVAALDVGNLLGAVVLDRMAQPAELPATFSA